MSLRAAFALGSSILVLLVACDGPVVVAGSSSGTSGSSGTSSGSSGSTSSGSSGQIGACSTTTLAGDRVCVPATAAAKQPIELAVSASDGCLGCFTSFLPCTVSVVGNQITVAMTTSTCQPEGDIACPTVCTLPETKCTLPGLPPGSYTVSAVGEGARPGLPPRELVVTDTSTTTSCTLSAPGLPIPPLQPFGFSTDCTTDADCAVRPSGSLCTQCQCQSFALATSALADYDALYRTMIAQCPGNGEQLDCAPCEVRTATCAAGHCRLN